ncbi:MAG TPA: carboxypeptidase-like regulatory domain-containing protein, partial [Thermoplasmata archaeon]|nr:carboxypeptidase-like regulatory domain-containing protein [Thermoplasmata archaeon]
AAIVGANVSLSPATGTAVTTTTNASGSYSFAALYNGTYSILVSKGGYKSIDTTVSISGQDAIKNVMITTNGSSSPSGGNSSKPSGGFLGTAAGQGVVVGVAVVAILVALAAAFLRRRKKGPALRPSPAPPEPSGTPPGKIP